MSRQLGIWLLQLHDCPYQLAWTPKPHAVWLPCGSGLQLPVHEARTAALNFKMVQYSTNSKCQAHHENQRSSSTPASAPSSNSWSHDSSWKYTHGNNENFIITPVTVVGTLATVGRTQGCRFSSSKEENMPTKAERNLNSTWDEMM